MYEFESRWTRGMKSRWTDYLDEPTLPQWAQAMALFSCEIVHPQYPLDKAATQKKQSLKVNKEI